MAPPRPNILEQPSSRLLCLPAELRNTIYRYTLLEPLAINIRVGRQAPPLLQTCRQVRKEAVSIYWTENSVLAIVVDFHHAIPCFLKQVVRRYPADKQAGGDRNYMLTGNPYWNNLMRWMKRVYSNTATRYSVLNQPSPEHATIAAMFAIANKGRAMQWAWQDVEQILEGHRAILGGLDRRWLLDR